MTNQTPISISTHEREAILALFRSGLTRGQVQAQLGWGRDRYAELCALHGEYLVGLARGLRAEGMDDLALLCRLLGWSESEQTRGLLERIIAAQEILRQADDLWAGDAWPVACDLVEILATWRPSREEICLAVGSSGPLLVSPTPGRLGHVAILGATACGKSTVLRLLLAQLAPLFPRGCYLLAPHFARLAADGTDWRVIESLLGGVASNGEEIEGLLAWAGREIEERARREAGGDFSWKGHDIYIAVDEWPEVLRRFPGAPELLAELLRRGRTYGIAVICAAQDSLPGDDPADFQTAYYLGGNPALGARLTNAGASAPAEERLGSGGACLLRYAGTDGSCPARVPWPGNDAVALLGGRGGSDEGDLAD